MFPWRALENTGAGLHTLYNSLPKAVSFHKAPQEIVLGGSARIGPEEEDHD